MTTMSRLFRAQARLEGPILAYWGLTTLLAVPLLR